MTDNTYKAIMIEAGKFNHDLTLQFGLLSYECEDEKDFIAKSRLLIDEMLKYDEADIDDMFFGNPRMKKPFIKRFIKFWIILQNYRCNQKYVHASASYNTSTVCSAFTPVPSFTWCLQLVPGAAMITSLAVLRTVGNKTSSPIFMDRS